MVFPMVVFAVICIAMVLIGLRGMRMTKPSYEEPGSEVAKVIEGSRNHWKRRAETAESELARVRGLLQRQRDAVHELYYAAKWSADRPVDEAALWIAVRDACEFEPGNAPKPSGESADIGKLDSADKQMPRCLACGIIGRHLCAYGGAETGGEKVAKCHVCGGTREHEGICLDCEPEKAACEHENAFVRFGTNHYRCPDCDAKIPVALPACTATTHTDDCRQTGECDRLEDYVTGAKELPGESREPDKLN